MDLEKIKKNLVKGAPARLLPVLPDSRKEERATSILLSVFSVVPEFSEAVLHEAGAKEWSLRRTTLLIYRRQKLDLRTQVRAQKTVCLS
jgi:hypothetical protein